MMTNKLIAKGVLKTPGIINAFEAIKRADFVPENLRDAAEVFDEALPIGFGQTISQPTTVAIMLELLQPKAGQKIMDAGSGSGWQTSLLAYIVSGKNGKAGGHIYAFERIPELCESGKENISKYGFIQSGVAEIFCQDASSGLPKKAPFDRIICAASLDKLPSSWREQCVVGGIIVAPIKNSVWRFKKLDKNNWGKREYPGFAFVPFISGRTT